VFVCGCVLCVPTAYLQITLKSKLLQKIRKDLSTNSITNTMYGSPQDIAFRTMKYVFVIAISDVCVERIMFCCEEGVACLYALLLSIINNVA